MTEEEREMASVGALLREAREKKKLTLDDAARATNITKNLIGALENDDFGKVPSPTYVKGFLKIYATYLGLDPAEVVREYLKDHAGASEQVLVLDVESKVKSGGERRVIGYAIIGGVAVLIVAIAAFAVKNLRPSRKIAAPPPRMEILEPSTLTLDETDLLEPIVPEPPREKELRLRAKKDEVWVKVEIDGVTVFQNIIKRGAEEFWKSESGFWMKIGRPDVVELTLDGMPITMSGKTSKPRILEIDAEGNVEVSN